MSELVDKLEHYLRSNKCDQLLVHGEKGGGEEGDVDGDGKEEDEEESKHHLQPIGGQHIPQGCLEKPRSDILLIVYSSCRPIPHRLGQRLFSHRATHISQKRARNEFDTDYNRDG